MEENRILAELKENYNYKISGISFLRDSGGKAYIVNSDKQKFLLKVAGKVFKDNIWQSVDVMCYLSRSGFPVPAVIETKQGMPVLKTYDKGQEYLFVLYEYIDGKEPCLCECGEKAGEMAGQLHKLLSGYKGTLVKQDYHFFIGRYIEILRRKNSPLTDTYAAIGAKSWEHVKNCPVSVCHGDLHRGNLLETADGKIYLFDFDTICIAPRMFDVMVICDMTDYFNLKPDGINTTKKVYKNFLTGYTRYINLTEAEIASFNDWVIIRHFQLQATIIEVFGIDCINNNFIENQLQWIKNWEEQQ